MPDLLEFEEPIGVLLKEIEALSMLPRTPDRERSIESLQRRADEIRAELYASLTPWQRVLVARHPNRPSTLDYVERLFTDFDELHGDRRFADDHAIVAEGLGALLGEEFNLVGSVRDGLALIEAVPRLCPDAIVADLSMPKMNGLEAIRELRRQGSGARVVVLTMHADAHIAVEAFRSGATAVKVFPIEQLGGPGYIRAIRSPLGSPQLIPTGGVEAGSIAEYLAAGAVAVGVGGTLFPRTALAEGDAVTVERLAKEIVAAVR